MMFGKYRIRENSLNTSKFREVLRLSFSLSNGWEWNRFIWFDGGFRFWRCELHWLWKRYQRRNHWRVLLPKRGLNERQGPVICWTLNEPFSNCCLQRDYAVELLNGIKLRKIKPFFKIGQIPLGHPIYHNYCRRLLMNQSERSDQTTRLNVMVWNSSRKWQTITLEVRGFILTFQVYFQRAMWVWRNMRLVFLVFMWRHHFPKQKNINPCEVLVLSYVRPSKNLTFCNVWARQGSSLCNRVRLNFQVCAVRDIKMKEWKRSRAGQKMSYCSSFG